MVVCATERLNRISAGPGLPAGGAKNSLSDQSLIGDERCRRPPASGAIRVEALGDQST